MSSSDIYSYETKLEDWVESLMRWMCRKRLHKDDTASVFNISAWEDFQREYPGVAKNMEQWLKVRNIENK